MAIPRIFGADKRRREAEAKERIRRAAPQLLEALQEITGYVEYMVGCGHLPVSALDHSRKSRAAIAAAKGE